MPKGVVSDQANEKFSSYELKLLRHSFISVNRNNFGPGKRGSLDVKKIKNPIVRVLKNDYEPNDTYTLGFIFQGESYILPQLMIDFDDGDMTCCISFVSKVFNKNDPRFTILLFQKLLIDFLVNRDRKFILVDMPYTTSKHFINIGCYKGKWFVATSHKYVNMDVVAVEFLPRLMDEFKKNSNLETDVLIKGEEQFQYFAKLDINFNEFFLLYAKTAFNALAWLKGHEFVLDEQFNKIRNAVFNVDGFEDIWIDKDIAYPEVVKNVRRKAPDKSHFVVLSTLDDILYAYVSFYGEPSAVIKMSEKHQNSKMEGGIICNWKNRCELILEDVLNEK